MSRSSEWIADAPEKIGRIRDEAAQLCTNCGMCCTGAIFSHGRISPVEFRDLDDDRPLYSLDDNKQAPLKINFPCACNVDSTCTVYLRRRSVCSDYRCELLKSLITGSISLSDATKVTDDAKAGAGWLKEAATTGRYFRPSYESLIKVLRDFIPQAKARARQAPLFEHEQPFLEQAFHYLRITNTRIEEDDDYLGALDAIEATLEETRTWFAQANRLYVRAKGSKRVLEIIDFPELPALLNELTSGWNFEKCPAPKGAPAMRIWKRDSLFNWDTPYPGPFADPREPLSDIAALASDLHYHLLDVYEADNPDQFSVHGMAAVIGEQTVLALGTHETGRSTLALELMGKGYRVISDDRVAIATATGKLHAVGTAFMARLPLPRGKSFAGSRRLFKSHSKVGTSEWAFLNIGPDLFAGRGEIFDPSAIVVLERKKLKSGASLKPASRADILKVIANRKIGDNLTTLQSFDALVAFLEGRKLRKLVYNDPQDAINLLEKL